MAPLLLEHNAKDLRMIRKAFATLLLILVALPFTAPFSTCDLVTNLSGANMYSDRPVRGPLSKSRLVDVARSHILPRVRIAARLNFVPSEARAVSPTVAPRTVDFHLPVTTHFLYARFVIPLRI